MNSSTHISLDYTTAVGEHWLRDRLKEWGLVMSKCVKVWRCFSEESMEKRVLSATTLLAEIKSGAWDPTKTSASDETLFTVDIQDQGGVRTSKEYDSRRKVVKTKHASTLWAWLAMGPDGVPITPVIHQPAYQGEKKCAPQLNVTR